MKTWMLSDSDLLRLMLEAGTRPGRGSPFRFPDACSTEEAPPAGETEPALIQAITRIARPDIVLGMVLYAPAIEPDYTWFYAREGDSSLASHRDLGGKGHEIVGPVDRYLLLESARSVLLSESPSRPGHTALLFDRDEFQALAAIVDVMQERGLASLLDRDPSRDMRFSESDIVATCNRSRQSPDARWMIPRATLFAPIGLSFLEEDLRRGLESLARRGEAVREGGFYNPGSELGLACSLLGSCSGLCALALRYRSRARGGDSHWRHRHVAGLRGAGESLWLFEFGSISSDAFEVELSSASDSIMHQQIRATILAGVGASSVAEEPGEKVPAMEDP